MHLDTRESEMAQAVTAQRRGDLPAAEATYRRLIERLGADADVEHMLAVTLHQQGRSSEALLWFELAGAQGGDARLWTNHASALLALGQAAGAAALCRRAIAVKQDYFGAWLNLGLAAELERDYGAAAYALEMALQIMPGQPLALRALARARLRSGSPRDALQILERFAEGTDADADLLRCEAWIETGEDAAAGAALLRLAAIDPLRTKALLLQARLAARHGSAQARSLLEQCVALDPEHPQANVNLAYTDIVGGELESGLRRLRDWLAKHPDDWNAANVYLTACLNSPAIDAPTLLSEHRRLRPVPVAAPEWPAGWRRRSRRLRVGWLTAHQVPGLLETLFKDARRELVAQSGDEIEHVFYALVDPTPQGLGGDASWPSESVCLTGLGDGRLLERLRADGLDILVDMVGRAQGNRLAVLAARVAPVQLAWFDAIQPSGIDAMDGLITDAYLSPVGAEANFTERLLRLPGGRLVLSPPAAQPPRLAGIASKTFVSLNRFAKLNIEVIDVWAAILRALPDWTLRLKGRGGEDADLAARLRARFADRDVGRERIAIEGFGRYSEALEVYQQAAIALDPFPFSGCANTLDALWMGVPVVTWPRDTLASRQSAALLDALGQRGWIAHDADSYVATAVALARDEPGRRAWRMQARERIVPALCDARRFAAGMLTVLRSMAPP